MAPNSTAMNDRAVLNKKALFLFKGFFFIEPFFVVLLASIELQGSR